MATEKRTKAISSVQLSCDKAYRAKDCAKNGGTLIDNVKANTYGKYSIQNTTLLNTSNETEAKMPSGHVDILKLPIVGSGKAQIVVTIPMSVIRTAAANLMELSIAVDESGEFAECRYVDPQRLRAPRTAGGLG